MYPIHKENGLGLYARAVVDAIVRAGLNSISAHLLYFKYATNQKNSLYQLNQEIVKQAEKNNLNGDKVLFLLKRGFNEISYRIKQGQLPVDIHIEDNKSIERALEACEEEG